MSQRVGLGSLEGKPPLLVFEAELYQLKASIKNFAAALKKNMAKKLYWGAEIVETTLVVSRFRFLRVRSRISELRISTRKDTTKEIWTKNKQKWPVCDTKSGKQSRFHYLCWGLGVEQPFYVGRRTHKTLTFTTECKI